MEENFRKFKIGEILHQKFLIDKSIIEEGLYRQKNVFQNKKFVGEILMDDGLISRDLLYHALALQKNIEYQHINNIRNRINFQLYKNEKIIDSIGKSHIDVLKQIFDTKSFPAYWEKVDEQETLVIIVTNPSKISQVKIFQSQLNKHFLTKLIITTDQIYNTFELKYNELTLEELENFSNEIKSQKTSTEDFLRYLLCYGILQDSSDIHISPSSNNSARISLRKLGTIETIFYVSMDDYNRIISVIKSKSDMNTNILSIPQDGRIDGKDFLNNVKIKVNRTSDSRNIYNINENELKYNFENVSFRVSTYPTEPPYTLEPGKTFEKCVIRILNLSAGLVELTDLGLSKQTVEELNFAKSRNQGIVFIVGPTGSGKSTTLYSVLSSLNSIERNIVTFEDPVEMRQMFWSQAQRNVNDDVKDKNFDYLEAKKSILRQDPDIILMGEVRDQDSATFATEAANTGHLVFTTLHANSSTAAFERIKKLGVNPLEMASSIINVLSQRLVKQLCPYCHIQRDISESEINTLKRMELEESKIPKKIYTHNIEGCKQCNHKGYVGRTTICEILPITSEIKQMIVNEEPEFKLRIKANEMGYKTLLEDGLERMAEGKVSINDILSVI